ncbi:hypothetical protein DEO72_LG5g2363 [Vigna unguiculata]|uniref:Uncharacterized protein n=1 Tax=Vigna unguiculata TaxID=3917 RepID=A0A4D6M0A4_VIGUN|nr:hypothetical protein DEO72_LG5g2363 [Vigna unguiculata]
MHHLCPRSRRHPSLSRGFAACQALLSSLSVSVGPAECFRRWCSFRSLRISPLHRKFPLPLPYSSLPPTDALRPIIPDNACILCLTAAAGTELADAYSPDTVIASSPGKEVHDPSLGRVSVPVWLIILSDQLLIIALCQTTQQALAAPEKEVIQPHLPVRLPCYDFTPITSPAFDIPLLTVKVTTLGMASSHSVTGSVYKARERIHCRLRSLRDLTQHLTARADDSHAPLVSAFPKAPLSFKRIRGMSNPDALRPIIPDNACILCLTAAAGTELADAYSPDTVIASSPGKEVHDPSLGRVSVLVWLIILSDQLLIIALGRFLRVTHPSATGNTTSRPTCMCKACRQHSS